MSNSLDCACFLFSKDHNCCLILKLWVECLKESLDAETRSRAIACKAQMKTFNFFFGLCLGQRHYSFTDNLSRTFKKEKTRAVSGQRLASLAAKTFENMRNDSDFALFYQKSCQQKKSMLHKKGFSCRQKQDDTGPKTISRLKKFNQKGNRQNFVHYSAWV